MHNKKNFFLISFLPALAYWYLEENYSLQIALMGGLLLATLEISIEKIFTKHVHNISKLNFYFILILGGIALIGQDGIWFKLQPFFTGIIMGGYLFFKSYTNSSLMLEMLNNMGQKIPNPSIVRQIEKDLSLFLVCYGIFMLYIALLHSTSTWTFFKTIGFYLLSFIFLGVELIFIRIKVRKQTNRRESLNES